MTIRLTRRAALAAAATLAAPALVRAQGAAPKIGMITTLSGPEIRFSVVKDVPLKPMNKEEAVMEMEKQGYNFWLYQEKGTKQMQVVFKRIDSTYGLLQAVKK